MTKTDSIKTIKATNEELLKQVALLTEQVEYLTRKLYGKSSEKKAVNTNQLSLFDEDNTAQDDEDLLSHFPKLLPIRDASRQKAGHLSFSSRRAGSLLLG